MGATGYIDPSVVTYVNDETGDVTLDAADVDADPVGAAAAALVAANAYTDAAIGGLPGAPVLSVNSEVGVVVLTAAEVGADATGSAAAALAAANSYTDTEIAALDAGDVGADPAGSANAALVAANSYTDGEVGDLSAATAAALAGKASTSHAATHQAAGSDALGGLSISQIASLQAALDALVPKTTAVNTAAPLTGGGALAGDLSLGLTFGQTNVTAAEGRAPRFAFAPWPISGRYIYTGYGANATTAQTLNQERCVPLPVWQGFTVSSLQVEVTTADANALWRIGLRAATATGLPGNLLVDYGTFSGAALGAIGPTGLSLAFADRTQYFLSATLQNGGGGTAALRAANWHDPLVLPASLGVLNTVISAYVQNGVTGALPPVSTPGDGNLGPRFMMLVV